MNCIKVTNLISAYIDGELSGREMLEIRHHLSICRSCANELEETKRIKSILSNLEVISPRENLCDMIISRLDEVNILFHVRFFNHISAVLQRRISNIAAGALAMGIALLMLTVGNFTTPDINYTNLKHFSTPIAEMPKYEPTYYSEPINNTALEVVSDSEIINGSYMLAEASLW